MQNVCKITSVTAVKNRLEVSFETSGGWARYFIGDKFWAEYSCDISGVPESTAVVPFLANFMPLAWICGGEFVLDEIDADFYECLRGVCGGYEAMYPKMNFRAERAQDAIRVNKTVRNAGGGGKSAMFFSGGVDAFSTLVVHSEEKPDLLTVWGADVRHCDVTGWRNVVAHVEKSREDFGCGAVYIKSNFRMCVDEGKCTALVMERANDGWWHGFQHGIALLGHAAPLVFAKGYGKIYIASSFTAEQKGGYTCASDPTIDNFVKFSGCGIVHDGYEFTRQDKVHNIVRFSETGGTRIAPRVCWVSAGGKNCCKCEKCYRTIMEFVAEGADPNDYGFAWDKKAVRRCRNALRYRIMLVPEANRYYYYYAQLLMKENPGRFLPDYKWFLRMDTVNFNHYPLKILYNRAGRILSAPIRALRKIMRLLAGQSRAEIRCEGGGNSGRTSRVTFLGDIMCQKNQIESHGKNGVYDFDPMFGKAGGFDGFTAANLETPISEGSAKNTWGGGGIAMRNTLSARPSNLRARSKTRGSIWSPRRTTTASTAELRGFSPQSTRSIRSGWFMSVLTGRRRILLSSGKSAA